MTARPLLKDDRHILNFCARLLDRDEGEIPERWRFPLVDTCGDGLGVDEPARHNIVTFLYDARRIDKDIPISVVGTCTGLHRQVSLRKVQFLGEDTGYRALSVLVPKGQLHVYRFVVGSELALDPINPQRTTLDDGGVWSRFFTDGCAQPISFERWELSIIQRMTDHVLPFRTEEGVRFLQQFYYDLSRSQRDTLSRGAYRLDNSVGIVHFIDKLLAREEHHRLVDYKICLREIDRLLRARNPYMEPAVMPRDMYVELYNEMSAGSVPGWDHGRYAMPRFFLQILRRHAYTGAFSHPRHGGNSGAAAWAFLSEFGKTSDGKSLFNWRRSLEPPLGADTVYRG